MKHILSFAFTVFCSIALFAQSWYEVPTPVEHKLNDIDFPSSSVGYIVGDSATLLRTTNGGSTWEEVSHTGLIDGTFVPDIQSVDFVDEMVGFVALLNVSAGSYKTTDGGLNWTAVGNPVSNMCFAHSVYATSEDDYYFGGAGCFQSGMINHFLDPTWTEATINYESFNPMEFIAEMDFNGSVGIAAMNGSYFLRSTDAGATWDTIPSGTTRLTSVVFKNADTLYAGYDENGSGFGVLMSEDGGLTWSQDINSATFYYPAYLSTCVATNGDVYLGAQPSGVTSGLIFETIGGNMWNYEDVDHPINGMASYGTDITFGVGDSGYVVVNTPLGNLSSPDLKLNDLTIYPNPTNDVVIVEFESATDYQFELIDLNGKKRAVDFEIFENHASFNIAHLPTGVYLLNSISTSKNLVHKILKR